VNRKTIMDYPCHEVQGIIQQIWEAVVSKLKLEE